MIKILAINPGCLKLTETRTNCAKENTRTTCNKILKGASKHSKLPHPLHALSARELERSCKRWKVYILLVLRAEKQFKPVTSTRRRKRKLVSSTVQVPSAGKVFHFVFVLFAFLFVWFFFTVLWFIGIEPYSLRVPELDICKNCTQLFLRGTASSSGDWGFRKPSPKSSSELRGHDRTQIIIFTSHSIQQQFSGYSGTVRLAKRWLSAQLLFDHVTEECIELLVASLFLSPAPFTPPR